MALNPNIQMNVKPIDTTSPLVELSKTIANQDANAVQQQQFGQEMALRQQQADASQSQNQQQIDLDRERLSLDQYRTEIARQPEQEKKAMRDSALAMHSLELAVSSNDKTVIGNLLNSPRFQSMGGEIAQEAKNLYDSGDLTGFSNLIKESSFATEHFGQSFGMDKDPRTSAAISLANEISKARDEGNTQRVNDLLMSSKLLEKGQGVDASGKIVPLAGSVESTQATASAKAAGKETGKVQGAAQANLGTVLDNATLIENQVNKMLNHSGMSKALGLIDSNTPIIKGTDAAAFKEMLDQVDSGAFLDAFEKLRGGGAITEIEGEKATKARTRMSLALNEKEFRDAAKDYLEIVKIGVARAKHKAAGDFSAPNDKASFDASVSGQGTDGRVSASPPRIINYDAQGNRL